MTSDECNKFNWRDYLNCNIDLQQNRNISKHNNNESKAAAELHYETYGKKENRIAYVEPYKIKNTVFSNDYTFVILRCVKRPNVSNLWIQCYQSIKKFHPNNKIVIIDNDSNYDLIKNITLENTEIIQHNENKSGEILPFYYFLKYKWSKYMIYFQDSMFLNDHLCSEKLNIETFKFFWHFNPGGHDNRSIINFQLSKLKNSDKIAELFKNKKKWFGSFGLSCTMNLEFLEFIENEHHFTNLVNYTNNRDDRKGLERVLGLLCSYYHFEDVYTSYFGIISICPNFGRNTIEDHQEPKSSHVKEWEKLFSVGKIFVCR